MLSLCENKTNFEVPDFEKYPCFPAKRSQYSLRDSDPNSLPPPPPTQPQRLAPLVSFGPPPPWIAPPRKKNLATGLLCKRNETELCRNSAKFANFG